MIALEKLRQQPRNLFLIDGIGALVSAIMLGIVLVALQKYFGIPIRILYLLAFLPILFAIYDFYWFFSTHDRLGFAIKCIGILNLLYCILSLGLAIYHHQTITVLGWIYVIIEIGIVTALALFEMDVGNNLMSRNQ